MIAIVDYGMGNIHSVNKALQSFGAKTLVTDKPEDLGQSDKIVLPGVGAFSDAMRELEKSGLGSAVKEAIKQKKTFLGICLGMQLLFEESEEAPKVQGLGVLKGKVSRFKVKPGLKVPHMGWNQINPSSVVRRPSSVKCPLLKNISQNSYVYFCHSYYPEPKDKNVIAATTEYGKDFASCVWKDNVFGVQFHPEKSQSAGLAILKNFVKLC
jgi:glutamine amidotransferase